MDPNTALSMFSMSLSVLLVLIPGLGGVKALADPGLMCLNQMFFAAGLASFMAGIIAFWSLCKYVKKVPKIKKFIKDINWPYSLCLISVVVAFAGIAVPFFLLWSPDFALFD